MASDICSSHSYHFHNVDAWRPSFWRGSKDIDAFIASSSTTQAVVKFMLRVIHHELHISEDGTQRLYHRADVFPERVAETESIFDLSTFKCSKTSFQKLSEMLSRLVPEQFGTIDTPTTLLQQVVDFGREVVSHCETHCREPRKVLPLFAEFDIVCVHVIHERRLVERAVNESRLEYEERDGYGMTPASKSAVNALVRLATDDEEGGGTNRRRTSGIGKDESCSICLEAFGGEGSLRAVARMPCSHVFHEICINQWLNHSHYCPLCRFEMPVEN